MRPYHTHLLVLLCLTGLPTLCVADGDPVAHPSASRTGTTQLMCGGGGGGSHSGCHVIPVLLRRVPEFYVRDGEGRGTFSKEGTRAEAEQIQAVPDQPWEVGVSYRHQHPFWAPAAGRSGAIAQNISSLLELCGWGNIFVWNGSCQDSILWTSEESERSPFSTAAQSPVSEGGHGIPLSGAHRGQQKQKQQAGVEVKGGRNVPMVHVVWTPWTGTWGVLAGRNARGEDEEAVEVVGEATLYTANNVLVLRLPLQLVDVSLQGSQQSHSSSSSESRDAFPLSKADIVLIGCGVASAVVGVSVLLQWRLHSCASTVEGV